MFIRRYQHGFTSQHHSVSDNSLWSEGLSRPFQASAQNINTQLQEEKNDSLLFQVNTAPTYSLFSRRKQTRAIWKGMFCLSALILSFINCDQHDYILFPRPSSWVLSFFAVKIMTHISQGCGCPARLDVWQTLNRPWFNKSKLNALLQSVPNHLHGYGWMCCAQIVSATVWLIMLHKDRSIAPWVSRLYWTSLLITL